MRVCGRRVGSGGGAIVGIAICLMASPARGQEPPPGRPAEQPPPVTEPAPGLQRPPVGAYPLELLGLLAPPAQRGPVTLTPSISVSEEYNDNLFFNNQDRQRDFITGFSPTITLFINRPSYQVNGGYSFTAELYERESPLNNALNRQNFFGTGLYRATPRLTLTASETYAVSRNTNLVASQGFATGRQESLSNTFGPGLTYQMTPGTSLSLGATYGLLRFKGAVTDGAGTASDSDTYGLLSSLAHELTPRLTGTIGYGFTYLTEQGQENSTTHTPTVGGSYRLTPTLTGSVSGGPAITELGGETFVSPAATASLVQGLAFGSASARYVRSVGAAGGFGGTTDIQTISGTLTLPTWRRGLLVVFDTTYNTAESVGSRQTDRVDVKALTLNLQVTYQITAFTSVFGGYTFFQQRTTGSSSQQVDADQNRVRFGLQFGYPINFD